MVCVYSAVLFGGGDNSWTVLFFSTPSLMRWSSPCLVSLWRPSVRRALGREQGHLRARV